MIPTLMVIDNYDSFTYNLVQMFRCYPLAVEVHRSDRITPAAVRVTAPDYLVISPGPKDPAHAGISMELIAALHRHVPTLGVCLGMQCINEVFGGRTIRAPLPMHGKTSHIEHDGSGLFEGLPSPLQVARYHSLAVAPHSEAPGEPLRINARARDGVIMGVAHRDAPLHGVQFHPESFLTEHGFQLIENFLALGPLGRAPRRSPRAGGAPQERSPAVGGVPVPRPRPTGCTPNPR